MGNTGGLSPPAPHPDNSVLDCPCCGVRALGYAVLVAHDLRGHAPLNIMCNPHMKSETRKSSTTLPGRIGRGVFQKIHLQPWEAGALPKNC